MGGGIQGYGREERTLTHEVAARRAAWWAGLVFVGSLIVTGALASTASAQGSDEEARALYSAGEIAYNEGRFQSALDYFQRAYELSSRPALLYNIGSAAERVRQDDVALAAFERYLAEMPEAPNRPAVEARIQILRTAIAEREAREAREAATAQSAGAADGTDQAEAPEADGAEPTGDSSGSSVVPWIVVGAGGAVAALGAVFVGLGYKDAGTVTDAPQGSDWSSVSGAYDRAPRRQGIGFALVGVGVAAAVTGVILAVTGDADDDASANGDSGVTAWVDRSTAGVLGWGTF